MSFFSRIATCLRLFILDRKDEPPKLVAYAVTPEISENPEEDLEFVQNQFPARVDLPKQKNRSLEEWRNRCSVLVSGISVPIGMKYGDSFNDYTARKIDVKKLIRGDNGQRYVIGFCHLRNAYRNFREDRIIEVVALETGEIYTNPGEFFDFYAVFSTPSLEKLQVFVHILSYLARADRRFDECEMDVISELIGLYAPAESRARIIDYAKNHKVTKSDFLGEIEKLSYFEFEEVNRLVVYAERLIKADGKVSKKEQEFFDALKSAANSLD